MKATGNDSSPFAGFWIRAAAFLIDKLLLYIVILLYIQVTYPEVIGSSSEEELERLKSDGIIMTAFLISAVYEILFTASSMQATIGKRILGLIVVDKDAKRLTLLRSIIRHFSKMLSEFLLGLGYLMAAFHDRKRGLHDVIAETYVVKI